MEPIQINQTQINGAETNSVNAREVYDYLEIKTPFTMWINRAIETYDFIEGIDFITDLLKNSGRGRPKKNYIVTIDMAKELCMVESNPKGKKTRKYFIKVEKKQSTALMSPNQITEALMLTAQSLTLQDERLDSQHERIQEVEIYIQEDLKSRPVNFGQQKALLDTKNKKVYQLSNDEKIQKKLHMKVWQVFKKNFNIPRYNEIQAVKFPEAIWFLENLELSDLI